MVDPALLAHIDELDRDELEELIAYAASKRLDAAVVADEGRKLLASRRHDCNPANWLTDDDFDARRDMFTS